MTPATCLPDLCFCEAIRHTGLMQPANAYSSLFFVIAALVVLWSARGRSWFGYAYAAALILVGLGSFWYHAELTLLTQAFDNFGMYFVVLVPIIAMIQKRYALRASGTLAGFILLCALSLPVILIYQGARRYEFIILILALLALDYQWGKKLGLEHRGYLLLALATFFISGVIWILDITGVWCMPWSLWQGHAVWHILNALAAYFLFFHYRKLGISNSRE